MAFSPSNDLSPEPVFENGHGDANSLTISQLYRELIDGHPDTEPTADDPDSGHRTEGLVRRVVDELFADEQFSFDEEYVKANLDELLVLLVGLREGETHGKGLMDDLERLFDSQLSPGTVYPRLHSLEAEGVLAVQELVRTKEYRVDDRAEARSRAERAMCQHLALGFLFRAVLDEL